MSDDAQHLMLMSTECLYVELLNYIKYNAKDTRDFVLISVDYISETNITSGIETIKFMYNVNGIYYNVKIISNTDEDKYKIEYESRHQNMVLDIHKSMTAEIILKRIHDFINTNKSKLSTNSTATGLLIDLIFDIQIPTEQYTNKFSKIQLHNYNSNTANVYTYEFPVLNNNKQTYYKLLLTATITQPHKIHIVLLQRTKADGKWLIANYNQHSSRIDILVSAIRENTALTKSLIIYNPQKDSTEFFKESLLPYVVANTDLECTEYCRNILDSPLIFENGKFERFNDILETIKFRIYYLSHKNTKRRNIEYTIENYKHNINIKCANRSNQLFKANLTINEIRDTIRDFIKLNSCLTICDQFENDIIHNNANGIQDYMCVNNNILVEPQSGNSSIFLITDSSNSNTATTTIEMAPVNIKPHIHHIYNSIITYKHQNNINLLSYQIRTKDKKKHTTAVFRLHDHVTHCTFDVGAHQFTVRHYRTHDDYVADGDGDALQLDSRVFETTQLNDMERYMFLACTDDIFKELNPMVSPRPPQAFFRNCMLPGIIGTRKEDFDKIGMQCVGYLRGQAATGQCLYGEHNINEHFVFRHMFSVGNEQPAPIECEITTFKEWYTVNEVHRDRNIFNTFPKRCDYDTLLDVLGANVQNMYRFGGVIETVSDLDEAYSKGLDQVLNGTTLKIPLQPPPPPNQHLLYDILTTHPGTEQPTLFEYSLDAATGAATAVFVLNGHATKCVCLSEAGVVTVEHFRTLGNYMYRKSIDDKMLFKIADRSNIEEYMFLKDIGDILEYNREFNKNEILTNHSYKSQDDIGKLLEENDRKYDRLYTSNKQRLLNEQETVRNKYDQDHAQEHIENIQQKLDHHNREGTVDADASAILRALDRLVDAVLS